MLVYDLCGGTLIWKTRTKFLRKKQIEDDVGSDYEHKVQLFLV